MLLQLLWSWTMRGVRGFFSCSECELRSCGDLPCALMLVLLPGPVAK